MATAPRAVVASLLTVCLAGCRAPSTAEIEAMSTTDLQRHVGYTFYPDASRQQARYQLVSRLGAAWPTAYRAAVLDARVAEGMNGDMVKTAWGMPTHATTQQIPEGTAQFWTWEFGGGRYQYVQLFNDRVVYVTIVGSGRP